MLFIRLTTQSWSHFIQMKSQSPNDGLQSPPWLSYPTSLTSGRDALSPCCPAHKPAFFLSKALVTLKIHYLCVNSFCMLSHLFCYNTNSWQTCVCFVKCCILGAYKSVWHIADPILSNFLLNEWIGYRLKMEFVLEANEIVNLSHSIGIGK